MLNKIHIIIFLSVIISILAYNETLINDNEKYIQKNYHIFLYMFLNYNINLI